MADERVIKGMAAQMSMRRKQLSSGARHLGWKVGFSTQAAMDRMGTTAPLFGFMTDRSLVNPGSVLSLAGWTRAVLEPEVAVHLGSDVPAHADDAEVRAAISGLGPAVELADFDPDVQEVEGILSGDIFHRHVLLGPVDRSRAGGSIAGVEALVFRNGEKIAGTSGPADFTGEAVVILRALAYELEANGEALRAGDVVITGSLVPPVKVGPGQALRAQIKPLGEIEVRFQEVGA
ncbi:MAG TPA: fumarylacetoacetate hydrolase family protein [Candidatus Dormibacteraeota bacterium]|nr:fumarylacetoacetate hydrolase family protein [Candidatus Dormibacteraeota bacterium]